MRIIIAFMLISLIASCSNPGRNTAEEDSLLKEEYLKKGEAIAKLTQGELLKNVSQAIGSGGPVYAIEFCNLKAMELKDSLSIANNATIQRISTKYRNPLDKPSNEREQQQLAVYQQAHLQGDVLHPELYILDDRVEYYQAITINSGACLLCHGDPGGQIASETLEAIRENYPEDLATGYEMHDFRGAWKITFFPGEVEETSN
jgi:hypothetical protein